MRIITWNSNMAFRKKWHLLLDLKPDILVIQECEHESKYLKEQIIPGYNEFLWLGDNKNKGVGIISFNSFHIVLAKEYTDKYKYIIPVQVSGAGVFTLFAIWAMPNKKSKMNGYVGQIWNAVNFYKSKLEGDCILIGDWNSNLMWDKERKQGNHSDVVSLLEEHKIRSVYHDIRQEAQGSEMEPTLYLLKKREKPYHIDYCFVSKNMITADTRIEVGSFEDWISVSDHMPLIIENLRSEKN